MTMPDSRRSAVNGVAAARLRAARLRLEESGFAAFALLSE